MGDNDRNNDEVRKGVSRKVAAKNIKLAIILGLVALGIYVTYMLTHLL